LLNASITPRGKSFRERWQKENSSGKKTIRNEFYRMAVRLMLIGRKARLPFEG
jgi:hypothetical protein